MRIRTVKPEFWRSDDIAALSIEDRLLFIGLWSYVDDSGIGVDKIAHICADLFAPDLEVDPPEVFRRVSGGLQKLAERGLITRYTVARKSYLHVTNWSNHQRIDKPGKRRYPLPDEGECTVVPEFREGSGSTPEKVATGTGEQGNRGTGEQGKAVVTLSDAEAPDPDEDFGLIEEDWQPEPQPKTTYPADFTAFWDVYPRRGGKGAAMTAFTKAKKRAPVTRIIDGAQSLANDPNLPADKSLIPMPATWLNQDRWEDDPLPARGMDKPQSHFLSAAERKLEAGKSLVAKYAEQESAQFAIEG